ncbi:TPA: hypothetical protein MO340_004269 [Salmonella enterica subsp. salamae serovar 35:g,m,s,t:-]|nr:hypothetical protein [Salmonella enterica subsp. salamae serovar 35:g,m,s,t:-]HCA3549739.1 hypothetical protein [Salmonella enterica subsp. salamae serovar 35:g,m,s,t:-]
MDLAIIYGAKKVIGKLADSVTPEEGISANGVGTELKHKVEDFETALKNAYNGLSKEEQDKVDEKVLEIRNFVRDEVKRDAKEHVKEALTDVGQLLNNCHVSSTITLTPVGALDKADVESA